MGSLSLIFILHKGSYSKSNIDILNTLQEKYDNFKIVCIQIENDYLEECVEIANIIASNLNHLTKCIYLKSNVIVQKDLRELFEVDLKHFNVGAVKELSNDNDFISSVMLLDIESCNKQQSNYEIMTLDLKYNLRADHLSEEKSFKFGTKIKLNPNLKTIYANKVIKSALTDNVIFNYPNNVTPISYS